VFTFPTGPLDSQETLLALPGTFWGQTYGGYEQAGALLYARGRLDAQTWADLAALYASVSRYTVPVFDVRRWDWLPLLEAQQNTPPAALPAFDGSAVFSATSGLTFGTPDSPWVAYPLPADVVALPLLCNRVSAPSRVLVAGQDYWFVPGAVIFRTDPLADPLVAVGPAWNGTGGTAGELWAFRPSHDAARVYRQFGYVTGLAAPSSCAYRDAVNAVWDAAVGGTASRQVQVLFEAALGVRLACADGETVVDTFYDARGLCIVTDRNVYRFALTATVLVAPGDVLSAGQALTDTLRFDEFRTGSVPAGLAALALGRGLLAPGLCGSLVFCNTSVPLVVASDPYGNTQVSFALGGAPREVERFWQQAHARGLAAGKTLAQLLDTRPNPSGQPTAAALPATVNPLAFLCANVLRDNAALVRLRPDGARSEGAGLAILRGLRSLLPPQTLVIVLVEFVVDLEPVTLDTPGSPTAMGATLAAWAGPAAVMSVAVDMTAFAAVAATGLPTVCG